MIETLSYYPFPIDRPAPYPPSASVEESTSIYPHLLRTSRASSQLVERGEYLPTITSPGTPAPPSYTDVYKGVSLYSAEISMQCEETLSEMDENSVRDPSPKPSPNRVCPEYLSLDSLDQLRQYYLDNPTVPIASGTARELPGLEGRTLSPYLYILSNARDSAASSQEASKINALARVLNRHQVRLSQEGLSLHKILKKIRIEAQQEMGLDAICDTTLRKYMNTVLERLIHVLQTDLPGWVDIHTVQNKRSTRYILPPTLKRKREKTDTVKAATRKKQRRTRSPQVDTQLELSTIQKTVRSPFPTPIGTSPGF